MWTIPARIMLAWPVPNYVNPQKKGPEIWIVSSIFVAFATFCVGMRLYTRVFIRRWFGLDDALILLAYVCL